MEGKEFKEVFAKITDWISKKIGDPAAWKLLKSKEYGGQDGIRTHERVAPLLP